MFINFSQILKTEKMVENNRNYLLGCDANHFDRECIDINQSDISTHRFSRKLSIQVNTISQLRYIISITYLDNEEVLRNYQSFPHKTIDNTIYPYLVCSKLKGYQVNLELSTTDESKAAILKALLDWLQSPQLPAEAGSNFDSNLSGIIYSISGKLPLSYIAEHFHLMNRNLQTLKQLFSEEFYSNLSHNSGGHLLRITVSRVSLQHYYGPLLKKLARLGSLIGNSNRQGDDLFKGWIRLIIESVVVKIIEASQSVRNNFDGNDSYVAHNEFLQKVLSSFIVDDQQMDQLYEDFQANMKAAENSALMYFNNERNFPTDWEISIQYNVTLSMKACFQALSNEINRIFTAQSFTEINRVEIGRHYLDCYIEELDCMLMKIYQQDLARQSLENELQKNILITFSGVKSMSSEETTVNIQLERNGVVMRPTYPILKQPSNIQMIESCRDKILIVWDMEDDERVVSYKVEYRNVTSTQWFSFMTKTTEKFATLDSIAAGAYVFKVCANFGDLLGAPSEESSPMSTLMEESNLWNNVCPLCQSENVAFAFVPCGHRICQDCSTLFDKSCHVCCGEIQMKLRLS